MKGSLLIAAVWALSACQSDSTPTMTLASESVSFAKLKGYEVREERGASVLVNNATTKKGSSIVVRRVSYDKRHDRTPESIMAATKASLAALPNSNVSAPITIEDAVLDGIQFELSFTPRSKRGRTYERRHAVLFGEANAYHVLQTAPKGRLSDISKDFTRVVETLREEG